MEAARVGVAIAVAGDEVGEALGEDGPGVVVAVGEGRTVAGWAVGVDLTRRDLQAEAKSKGRPWEAGKAFDQSAPCGAEGRPWM